MFDYQIPRIEAVQGLPAVPEMGLLDVISGGLGILGEEYTGIRFRSLLWMCIGTCCALYIPSLWFLCRMFPNGYRFRYMDEFTLIWNMILSILSGMGLYIIITERPLMVISMLWNERDSSSAVRLVLLGFIFSKIVEFGDTYILVLRGRPLTFLHVYHHLSVAIFSLYNLIEGFPYGHIFAIVNLFVHTIMYMYYSLMAMSKKYFKRGRRLPQILATCRPIITLLQVIQMFIGMFISLCAFKDSTGWLATVANPERIYYQWPHESASRNMTLIQLISRFSMESMIKHLLGLLSSWSIILDWTPGRIWEQILTISIHTAPVPLIQRILLVGSNISLRAPPGSIQSCLSVSIISLAIYMTYMYLFLDFALVNYFKDWSKRKFFQFTFVCTITILVAYMDDMHDANLKLLLLASFMFVQIRIHILTSPERNSLFQHNFFYNQCPSHHINSGQFKLEINPAQDFLPRIIPRRKLFLESVDWSDLIRFILNPLLYGIENNWAYQNTLKIFASCSNFVPNIKSSPISVALTKMDTLVLTGTIPLTRNMVPETQRLNDFSTIYSNPVDGKNTTIVVSPPKQYGIFTIATAIALYYLSGNTPLFLLFGPLRWIMEIAIYEIQAKSQQNQVIPPPKIVYNT